MKWKFEIKQKFRFIFFKSAKQISFLFSFVFSIVFLVLLIISNFWTIWHKTDHCVSGWMMLFIYNSIVGFCWTVLVQLALGLWTHVENWFSSQCLSHPTAPRQSQSLYPKYSKHWPYLLAATMSCNCSKILNHGLNDGSFVSLFNFLGVNTF